ncbi:MAG: hypothetical protein K9K75_00305 [Deltaproteobacteria bacterium]|nr:hypothetical protein [Deltaproteobacteria bacterium]
MGSAFKRTKIWGVGYVFFVPNIPAKKEENPVREVQKEWRERQAKRKEPYHVLCIYGECKCLEFLKVSLADNNCRSLTLLFGDKIWAKEQRGQLEELLSQYPERLTVFRHQHSRPPEHGILMADNVMIESEHDVESTYEMVQCTEKATKRFQRVFKEEFERLRTDAERIDINNVSGLPLYDHASDSEVAC